MGQPSTLAIYEEKENPRTSNPTSPKGYAAASIERPTLNVEEGCRIAPRITTTLKSP
jgi:hypothetical protein